MLDHLHIYLNNHDARKLLRHPELYELFNIVVATNTAEIKGIQIKAHWQALKFVLKPKKYNTFIDVSGSFQKHSQNGRGHRDFSFKEMSDAIINFCNTFGINPYDCALRSFEFGVNLAMQPSKFIYPIVLHKTKAPDIGTFEGLGLMKEFVHRQYNYRLYDKCKKEGIEGELLRIELKIKKMAMMERISIKSLADLLDLKKWHLLKDYLVKPINEMVFTEELTQGLKESDNLFYYKGKSPDYWIQQNKENRHRCKYERKLYRNLMTKNGNDTQGELIDALKTKCEELLQADTMHFKMIDLFLNKYRRQNQFCSNCPTSTPQIILTKKPNHLFQNYSFCP
jgi:hypothetical protein